MLFQKQKMKMIYFVRREQSIHVVISEGDNISSRDLHQKVNRRNRSHIIIINPLHIKHVAVMISKIIILYAQHIFCKTNHIRHNYNLKAQK